MAHLLETRGLAIRLLRVIPSTDHLQSFHMYRDIIDSQNCLVSLTMTKVIEGIVWVFIRDWCSVEPSFMDIISTHLNDFKCPFKEPSKWTEAAFRVVCKNSLCPVHSWNWHYWDRLLMIIVYSLEKHSRASGVKPAWIQILSLSLPGRMSLPDSAYHPPTSENSHEIKKEKKKSAF